MTSHTRRCALTLTKCGDAACKRECRQVLSRVHPKPPCLKSQRGPFPEHHYGARRVNGSLSARVFKQVFIGASAKFMLQCNRLACSRAAIPAAAAIYTDVASNDGPGDCNIAVGRMTAAFSEHFERDRPDKQNKRQYTANGEKNDVGRHLMVLLNRRTLNFKVKLNLVQVLSQLAPVSCVWRPA